MANCFGEIVDDYKLDTIPRYVGQPKTQQDRAREAMKLQNEDGKNTNAASYVDDIKARYGDGMSTLCRLYNATGETLYYVADKDWFGYIGRTPYPHEIGNGQWAAFLHIHKTSASSGSEAAIVYRGKDKNNQVKDFLVGWSTPWSVFSKNKAYCHIGGTNSFQSHWDSTLHSIDNADYSWTHSDGSGKIEASTATGSSPVFTATFSIPFSK